MFTLIALFLLVVGSVLFVGISTFILSPLFHMISNGMTKLANKIVHFLEAQLERFNHQGLGTKLLLILPGMAMGLILGSCAATFALSSLVSYVMARFFTFIDLGRGGSYHPLHWLPDWYRAFKANYNASNIGIVDPAATDPIYGSNLVELKDLSKQDQVIYCEMPDGTYMMGVEMIPLITINAEPTHLTNSSSTTTLLKSSGSFIENVSSNTSIPSSVIDRTPLLATQPTDYVAELRY